MSSAAQNPAVVFCLTAVLSLVFTRLLVGAAQKRGWVAKPKADRWHVRPTALYGGVAIFGSYAFGGVLLLFGRNLQAHSDLMGLLFGAVLLFLVGLRDDIKPLNPLVKLLGQVMSVTPFLVGVGLSHMSPAFLLSMPFLMFWMLALTNALNLLDNMDGLSAGCAAVMAVLVAVASLHHGLKLEAALSVLLAAACLGFLRYNFRPSGPARIFMGDCSSMFLGFMLAGLTVIGVYQPASSPIQAVSVSLLLLAYPLFDTTLVIVMRKREGRAISQGGRDHSSHRLVYSGRSEKRAVLLLYGLCLLTGGTGLLADRIGNPAPGVGLAALWLAALAAFGAYLSRFTGPKRAAVVASSVEEKRETNGRSKDHLSRSGSSR